MDFWYHANGLVSLSGAGLLSCVILHPRIHEGLVVKVSLIAMVIALGATACLTFVESEDWGAFWRAGFVLRAGLVGVICGCLLRLYAPVRKTRRHFLRRKSDFFGGCDG